ncbi:MULTISPECIES: ead/Ea22-like family protein [Klebsiella]|uniref:Ead domain protein n=4 Tax=Klebsiella pneumoniae TaxID=573 RepID=A0A486RUX8_KLEPN|nr:MULTISPECIES: ead/Ea22-like family protein [Klebsiella]EIV2151130.1 ead/Ea22-like family protein [Klebsiella pneumoniae]EIV6988015.1 ead/Ea22-like family protein [Klebsiella pneumoniae]EIW9026736.1 ead/Ea22-like family protein [Klebsiella pneumoniae]EJK9124246.1 ead/Ea22-like family protein [Klebsiella pneumoniae]EJM8618603.1 ead/Ea22-like family protein [Klebsiella pneumoniae]
MTTDITELAQSLKAAAEKATPGEWVYFPKNTSIEYDVGSDESQGSILYVDSGDFTQVQTDRNGEFIALANPANVLALVEALEKAQQERENWRTSFDNERFRADKLKAYIDDMEPIRAAAEKLVRCKGRYHSEQNYRALAALFGVKTPDLPPLENENVHYADAAEMEIAALRQRIAELESHTVKLPKPISVLHRREFTAAHCAIYAYPEAEVNAALAAAGIKWEVE